MSTMDSHAEMEYAVPVVEGYSRENLLPTPHKEETLPPHPVKNLPLRGSGSYPTMIRARTANRNKITKRTSDSSMIITGHHRYHHHHHHHGHHVSSSTSSGGGGGMMGTVISEGSTRSASSKKRKLLNNKRTVFSKASRRKSLENLGLLVRNRCGTAKLQWPSEKKETDVFDLLPEGCIQVRQLIRLKSRGGGATDGGGDRGGSYTDFYGGDRRGQRRRGDEDDYCDDETEENANEHVCAAGKGLISRSEGKLNIQGRRRIEAVKTDWKNKKNISVIVRIRPKLEREVVEKSIVFRTDSKTIVFDPKEKTKDFYFQGVKQLTRNDFGRKRPNRNVSFQYDKVYGPEATNKEIFEEMLRDLTDHLIEGYNSTVFAYGATGSGKTHTMIGSNSNPGLTVLMVESLYKRIEDLAEDFDCEVACSYLEVYNETIKDLLRPEKELSIREDGKKGIIISELSFYKPRGPQELLKLLRSGNRARTQHATDLNAESSRSHAVFEVKLCLKRKKNAKCQQNEGESCNSSNGGGGPRRKYGEQAENIKSDEEDGGNGMEDDGDNEHGGINKVEVIQSKLVMVDLAGSERGTAASSSNHGGVFSDGARQREGASINKSLLALASCISALADGKCHVPYRNSKLTRLLKDSLNGLCTTVMIANISPSAISSEDTYNTLKYADRAKSIVGPVAKQKNIFMEDMIVEDCAKTQMAELEVKNIQLQEQLEEEKLKRELILKELEELQRESVEMKWEAGQEERNVPLVAKMKGKGSRRKSMMGGGGDGQRRQIGGGGKAVVDYRVEAEDGPEEEGEECCFGGENGGALWSEDQLPSRVQEYIQVGRERARIFSEYVEFASETRFAEWAISCKKMKADMADFLGRLPVEDQNYVCFSKLKNEVNNSTGTFRNNNGESVPASANEEIDRIHKKYAARLKNLTEKLELLRENCVEKELHAAAEGDVPTGEKMVTISLEQFLQFKRLSFEHEANGLLDRFYQEFCKQINNQLMTSGMTLMNALKTVKSLYLQLRQAEESTVRTATTTGGKGSSYHALVQQEYKELLDLVYGPGPPLPPPQKQEDKDADYYNNNSNISSNVNNDSLLQPPLSAPPPPQNPPQLSNFSRKSCLIMDGLANMVKLVERPLLVQFTSRLGTLDGESEIKEGEPDSMEFSGEREEKVERTNSTFSRFVTSTSATASRKSLSTSHAIYESPKPPPGTRVRGGESSPELQLPPGSHHRRATCIEEEEEEDDDDEESRYNDDHVQDNDRHYLHPPCVIDNDDDDDDSTSFPANGPFQVETSVITAAANGSCSKEVWNSTTTTTPTNNISGDDDGGGLSYNLVNPVERKNSTSFEIIFDKKEDKRAGGRGHGKTTNKLERIAAAVGGVNTESQCSPSVMSALSKQKISENHFNKGNGLNEEWTTTTTSSSGTVTGSSTSTSAENVMMKGTGGGSGSVQQKKFPIGNKKRLGDQALIKDYQNHPQQHLHLQQTKPQKTGVIDENRNKSWQEEEEMDGGNPSSYIYQLDSFPSPTGSSIDVVLDGIGSNKRGFGNADHSDCCGGESKTTKRKESNKIKRESKLKTATVRHSHPTQDTNLNLGRRHRGHLKQQEGKNGVLAAATAAAKPDIGSSWNKNNKVRQQQCGSTRSGSKNIGGGGGKSLNPLLSVAGAEVGVITSTTPSEFSMNVQGQQQRRSQPQQQQQQLLRYKVNLPVKKSIAVHPSKATTDLTRSLEQVDIVQQQQSYKKIDPLYHHQNQKKEEHLEEDEIGLGAIGDSGEEESEWEESNSAIINMPHTNRKSKQGLSQHSLVSSARSTMSHQQQQKAPYFTNCKTFTISRESLPTANMPVISSWPPDNNNGTGRQEGEEYDDNFNEEYTSGEDNATSCYSDD